MDFKFSKRIESLPPYLFAEINRIKAEVAKRGVDIIDLGIGDPDMPTPDLIVEQMKKEVSDPGNHQYPPYLGMDEYRDAVSVFFKERFGQSLDPKKEIIALIGSKEAIFHFPFVMLDEGDVVLVPDPGYPVYSIATRLAGGEVHKMPLLEENDFLPDLESIPVDVAKKAKMIFINYPNNPTSACADRSYFEELYEFAGKNNIVVCHDMAYSEVYFGKPPLSFLEVDEKKELTIEFHSLSKTFNMTGWRVGFAAGNEKLVGALGRLKTNIDSGVFQAIQKASVTGLKNWKRLTEETRKVVSKRIAFVGGALKELGYRFKEPQGTFYLWVQVPGNFRSKEFTARLLEKTGVVVTPGVGMGESGDGYFRISLTSPDDRLKEAVKRLKGFKP